MSRTGAFNAIPRPRGGALVRVGDQGRALVRVGDQGWAQQAARQARQSVIDVDVRPVGTSSGGRGKWFRDQKRKAQEMFQATMNAPKAVVGTTVGVGATAGAFALANSLENRAEENTAAARAEEEAQRKAQQQFDAYKQAAENAASAMDELDYVKRSNENTFLTAEELRSEEARQNMFLSMNRKAMEAEREELAKRQPYLSASRFRESMPTAINAASANFQAMLNSFQGYR